jgi:2-oxoglutarate ferredoxin oxidoreductase subunit beta
MSTYTVKDFKSDLKPVWCPGCGDFGVLNSIYQALAQLQLPPEEVVIASGIGCSSRLPGYVSTYGFNAIHGRALPIAQGVKLARPKTTVIAVGGDGDGLSIGGGHFPHMARRNINLTYIMLDNGIYGMTKGQLSPTTGGDQQTKTTPYGVFDDPMNPLKLALAYDASFIGRGFSGNVKQTVELIVKAINHQGFSFLQILSPCVTFVGRDQFDILRELIVNLPESYDPTSVDQAWKVSNEIGKISLGVIYETHRDVYEHRLEALRQKAQKVGPTTFDGLLQDYQVSGRAHAAGAATEREEATREYEPESP